MTREEVERNIEKWREIARPFMDKKDKLNVRRDELLREMEQLQEDYIKALPVKIGDKIMHWAIGFGLVLVVVLFILETSLQLRIYFGRALPNWGVVVSRPSNRKGAATLATQQSLASSKGVCHKMYTFRSSMNEGELSDKYKAMVCTMDVLKPDWDRIRKKRRKRF